MRSLLKCSITQLPLSCSHVLGEFEELRSILAGLRPACLWCKIYDPLKSLILAQPSAPIFQSNRPMLMLRLRGGPALSPFRLERLASALKIEALQVSHISTEYWYFCAARRDLREEEMAILEQLLKCPPKLHLTQTTHISEGELLLVVPRPGTISPWSTKATDIAHHCGLEAVERYSLPR